MKKLLLSLLVAASCEAKDLIWHDEFDGAELNTKKWNPVFQDERHQALCTKDQVTVHNGNLWIRTETKGGKIYTGIMYSKFEAAYGYWEIRAKCSDVSGTWSDAWLYNWNVPRGAEGIHKYGMEVDIFEHRKLNEQNRDISKWVLHTLHWNGYGKQHECRASQSELYTEGFHTYGVNWLPDRYEFYIDGRPTWIGGPTTSVPLFLVLSTEVMSDFWAGHINGDLHEDTLVVDYVRYYK